MLRSVLYVYSFSICVCILGKCGLHGGFGRNETLHSMQEPGCQPCLHWNFSTRWSPSLPLSIAGPCAISHTPSYCHSWDLIHGQGLETGWWSWEYSTGVDDTGKAMDSAIEGLSWPSPKNSHYQADQEAFLEWCYGPVAICLTSSRCLWASAVFHWENMAWKGYELPGYAGLGFWSPLVQQRSLVGLYVEYTSKYKGNVDGVVVPVLLTVRSYSELWLLTLPHRMCFPQRKTCKVILLCNSSDGT